MACLGGRVNYSITPEYEPVSLTAGTTNKGWNFRIQYQNSCLSPVCKGRVTFPSYVSDFVMRPDSIFHPCSLFNLLLSLILNTLFNCPDWQIWDKFIHSLVPKTRTLGCGGPQELSRTCVASSTILLLLSVCFNVWRTKGKAKTYRTTQVLSSWPPS